MTPTELKRIERRIDAQTEAIVEAVLIINNAENQDILDILSKLKEQCCGDP